jgi:SagB-type dehydrogenase family enzyme
MKRKTSEAAPAATAAGVDPSAGDPPESLSPLWFQSVLDNTVKTLDPWFGSSGFRPNHARFRSAMFDQGPRIAETYLLNTRLQRHDAETSASVLHYFSDQAKAAISLNGIEANAGRTIDLPAPIELSLRLSKCLSMRRSRRVYSGDPIQLQALATLCQAAAGTTGQGRAPLRREDPPSVDVVFRSAPSAGALYGLDLYVVAQRVGGLDPGVYLYQSRHDRLLLLSSQAEHQAVDRVRDATAYPDQTMTNSRAAVVFLLVARHRKLLRKYGDRGLRYLFIEAGEMTQNIHLAAVALGLGTVESASFYDDEMNEALRLDGGTSTVVHMILAGLPATV